MEIVNIDQLSYGVLFVSLLFYILKRFDKMENNYQNIIDTLSNKVLTNTEIILERIDDKNE